MPENRTVSPDAEPQRVKIPELAITPVGRIHVRREGQDKPDTYTVVYGNVLNPIIDNRPMFLPTGQYLKMMSAFYESSAGRDYVIYDEDKLLEDYLSVRKRIEENCANARQEAAEKRAKAEAEAKARAAVIAKQEQERAADEKFVVDNLYEKDRRVRKLIDDQRAKEQSAAEQQLPANGQMERSILTGEAAIKAAEKREKMLNANGIPADSPRPSAASRPAEPASDDTAVADDVKDSDSAPVVAQKPDDTGLAENTVEDSETEPSDPDQAPEAEETDQNASASAGDAAPVPDTSAPVNQNPPLVRQEHLKPLMITMLVFEILIVLLLACILAVDILGGPFIISLLGLA